MAKLTKNDAAQTVLAQRFELNFDDTMVDAVSGTSKDFGKVSLAGVFDVIDLPPGAVVTGGHWGTLTAFDTAGLDVIIGDADSTARYFASADVKGLGAVAIVPTGFVTTGKPIRVTVASDDVCTAGKAALVITYVIKGRANEVS